MSRQTTAELVSWTQNPLETLYVLWQVSRLQGYDKSPQWVSERMGIDPAFNEEVERLFLDILNSRMPLIEQIAFTFVLRDVPISLREHIVRHRVGSKVGDRVGHDIIPDLPSSSWWAQTMRNMDRSQFATREEYLVPDTFAGRKVKILEGSREVDAVAYYREFMAQAEDAYQKLVAAGIPTEDARNVVPLSVVQDMSWSLNGGSMRHIFGNRCCWIAQVGIWAPLITSMAREMAEKIHPLMLNFAVPPCWDHNGFNTCKFRVENGQRVRGVEDPQPPCALWLRKEHEVAREIARSTQSMGSACKWYYNGDRKIWTSNDPTQVELYRDSCRKFAAMWPTRILGYDRDNGPSEPEDFHAFPVQA